MEGIFLLYGELSRTITESQVIVHVRSMRKAGVDIEVWIYTATRKSFLRSQKLFKTLGHYDIPLRIFRGLRPALPFPEVLNALLLWYHLHRARFTPDFIHCRTEYAASVAGFLKPSKKFRLIWDCRGDTESEFLFHREYYHRIKWMLSFAKLYAIKFCIWWASKQADEAIFVSDELKKLHGKNVRDYRSTVIPCTASSEYFYFNPDLRSAIRKQLGFKPSEKVFVYSGSLVPWQCFKETMELIKKTVKQDPSFKAIILTPDVTAIQKFLQDCPRERVVCISATLTEVNAYLNAADFGFLLRRPGPINRVASPTKFAEYCLAGLPVITTSAVDQAYKLGTQLGNVIIYEFGQELELPEPLTDVERHKIAERAKRVLSRETVLDKYLAIYQRRSKTCR